MRYRLLGRSGLRVSEICLGTMTLGEDWGWGASREESARIFEAFAGAGGNFIDTANNYTNGTSERYVGEFVSGERERFVIATKYSLSTRRGDPNAGGNHPKSMRQAVDASLRRLQTEYVDVLYLHMWDYTTPVEAVVLAFDHLVRAGKILHWAFSDTPAWVIAQAVTHAALRGLTTPVAIQVPYNLSNRDPERELIPMARATGLGVTAWAPLGQGAFTGRYSREHPGPNARGDTFGEREMELARQAAIVASDVGRPVSQVAINWLRGQDVIPIVGARTLDQITENLRCLEWELSEENRGRLDEAGRILLGFPQGWLNRPGVRDLIFGGTYSQLMLGPS